MMDSDTETTALRTLIVDDEPLAVERVQVICAEIPVCRWSAPQVTAPLRSGWLKSSNPIWCCSI